MQVRLPSSSTRVWTSLGMALLILAGGLCGYWVYNTARDAVLHTQFALSQGPNTLSIPGPATVGTPDVQQQPTAEPGVQAAAGAATPSAVRPQRINILLLGLDTANGHIEAARTDTIIVVSIDPTGGPVTMLSIPRDLWVPIGPYGENRINTAYFLGEVNKYPGGGPALLQATVEQNFGIAIDHYVVVDFDGFRRLIDLMGGVTVTVEKDIYDASFPTGVGDGTKELFIPAGVHHFTGEEALEYVRARHETSDFDRAARQQHLLLAIRDQVLRGGTIASLLPRLPTLYRTFSDTVQTDMALDDMLRIARLVEGIDVNNVETAVIDETMTKRYITDNGWDVLLPIQDKIEPLVHRLFRAPQEQASPLTATGEQAAPAALAEAARVLVVNGSGRAGMADVVAGKLRAMGLDAVSQGDLDHGDYAATILIAYSDKPASIRAVIDALGISADNVRQSSDSPAPANADIKVIVGQDYASAVG